MRSDQNGIHMTAFSIDHQYQILSKFQNLMNSFGDEKCMQNRLVDRHIFPIMYSSNALNAVAHKMFCWSSSGSPHWLKWPECII